MQSSYPTTAVQSNENCQIANYANPRPEQKYRLLQISW